MRGTEKSTTSPAPQSAPAQQANPQSAIRNPQSLPRIWESLGYLALALLAAWFLHLSWRKWPDPFIDSGPQWYAIWRVSLGAVPYRDIYWNYGPLSLVGNALLFRCFGPGMMVLVAANLVVYAAILKLAYVALRQAWGWVAAFAACAVFISVFSFSILNGIGNYNFAAPYAPEAAHGLLLLLAAVFITVRWSGKSSKALAFCLGLCGGLAAVLKPEFMLASAVLGIAALALRGMQRLPVRAAECALILAGVCLPTLAFAAWFARWMPWKTAFVNSCQAWWLVLFNHRNPELLPIQQLFTGFDHPWPHVWREFTALLGAAAVIGAIWAAGWFAGRPWPRAVRLALALAAAALACLIHIEGGWLQVGWCLPGLMIVAFSLAAAEVWRDLRQTSRIQERHAMSLMLVLAAGTMLARMALYPRIDHFGFFQAAPAGMVVTAVIVSSVPQWTGSSVWGRGLALWGVMVMLAAGCASIAGQSAKIRADQTQPVGTGADRFFAFDPEVSDTGLLVNWSVEQLRSVPPGAPLLVVPDGLMINYLSRRASPQMPELTLSPRDEELFVKQMALTPPEHVLWITRDMHEGNVPRYGAPGGPGSAIRGFLAENYAVAASQSGRPHEAVLFRKKSAP